ncbi:MAG: hypothetical protein ACE5I1_26205 [bacterium]
MWNDPIVEEVRRTRLQIEAECDHDINKIYAKLLELQGRYNQYLVTEPFTKIKKRQNRKKAQTELAAAI